MGGFDRVDTTANRLRIAMDSAGMRQTDLADKAGVNKGALSRYLKGIFEPKQDVIYKLAQALDVSEMWLWGYDCDMQRSQAQKNNDAMTDIVIKMRSDEVFFNAVNALYQMEPERLKSLLTLLK